MVENDFEELVNLEIRDELDEETSNWLYDGGQVQQFVEVLKIVKRKIEWSLSKMKADYAIKSLDREPYEKEAKDFYRKRLNALRVLVAVEEKLAAVKRILLDEGTGESNGG